MRKAAGGVCLHVWRKHVELFKVTLYFWKGQVSDLFFGRARAQLLCVMLSVTNSIGQNKMIGKMNLNEVPT